MVIERTAVLGAGVMGAAIAAHLTNVGLECTLLDILPQEITAADRTRGWTEASPDWRNSIAVNALSRLATVKPTPFYTKKNLALIRVGNLEDNIGWLSEADWVIEAVVEDLDIKQDLLRRVEEVMKPDCIVSTNTSGLPIKNIAAPFSPRLKGNFLGVHFFNPPRYMKLLEIIPLPGTRSEIVDAMVQCGEESLGKGVVVCSDTPGFVANRLGSYDIATAIRLMIDLHMGIEDVDALAACLGRAGSAIFGTLDMVGLDIAHHVIMHLYENLPEDPEREIFLPPRFIGEMMKRGWLGNKTIQGFYRKAKNGNEGKLVLDYRHMAYRPHQVAGFASLSLAKKAKGDTSKQVRILFAGDDKAGEFAREYLCRIFRYVALQVPDICDSILSIDRAMKWGYNHELGPFEIWDAIGLEPVAHTMEHLGLAVPEKIQEMIAAGFKSFYINRENGLYIYDVVQKEYVQAVQHPRHILLSPLKKGGRIIKQRPGASLVDLGDGIACLEFHTKLNTIDDDMIHMMDECCDIVEKNFLGMVIGNNDVHFSAGANIAKLLALCRRGDWEMIGRMVAAFQGVNMRMKYLSRPVIAAPSGLTLGGGCEMSMHAARCQPYGETYMGLVEVGVGLIPAGGGCKELMLRLTEGIPDGLVEAGLNLQHHYIKALQNIVQAHVAGNAREAMELGYIRKTEHISANKDRQLWEAKQGVIGLVPLYRKPLPPQIPVMGEAFRGLTDAYLFNIRRGNYCSDYDVHVAQKVAHVLSGGDCPEGTLIPEQEILDREREAFLSLCGEPNTQERITHMLETGKPLRN